MSQAVRIFGPMLIIAALPGSMFAQPAAAPNAAEWKTWVISSAADHRVPAPPSAAATENELSWVRSAAAETHPLIVEQIRFWDSGPASYRWIDLLNQRVLAGKTVGNSPVRAYAYLSMAIYDATVAAFNAKQTYRRARPSQADANLQTRVAVPQGYSYPSDYAAAAGAAAAVMAYLVPGEATYFQHLAEEAGKSRLYAGVEYPSDYFAGMELGRRVAEQVIAKARMDGSDAPWTGTIPTGPCKWTGVNPGNAGAAHWRPILMTSPSEFRPPAPPACDSAEVHADLEAVKKFPRALNGPNFNTNSRAFYWQTAEAIFPWAFLNLNKWILEDRLENNPLRAARAYALVAAVTYDAWIASQDGKFTYWYIRPAQLDPSLVPLFPAPNFPSYPSNHSTMTTARSEVMAYLFPDRANTIRALGKEAGDSRIWAGIHFEMDNQAGATLGKNVAAKFIAWAQNDGSGQ